MLSPYTAYTLSVAVAHMFPVHVQRYYNSVLEPFFTMAVPDPIQATENFIVGLIFTK